MTSPQGATRVPNRKDEPAPLLLVADAYDSMGETLDILSDPTQSKGSAPAWPTWRAERSALRRRFVPRWPPAARQSSATVVVAAGSDPDLVGHDLVDEPMLIGDPA